MWMEIVRAWCEVLGYQNSGTLKDDTRGTVRTETSAGEDIENLDPGFKGALVSIPLPLDVLLALVFEQYLAVACGFLPLCALRVAFPAGAQCDGRECWKKDGGDGFHDCFRGWCGGLDCGESGGRPLLRRPSRWQ